MSPDEPSTDLSRRERQIMDALYRLGEASAAEIHAAIPDPPTYTAVRTLLGVLHSKGHVKILTGARKYLYQPVVPRDQMARRMIDDVVANFFQGSVESVVAHLIGRRDVNLTDEQLDSLLTLIEEAKREGR